MHLSSQWFVAQAVSAVRHGIGSRLAVRSTRPARSTPLRRRAALPAAFGAAVASEHCLGIDDGVGCTLRVVEGQVWITVDGHLRDIIANAGDAIALERGARTYVSAFRDAVVLIAPGNQTRDVAFEMRETHGLRTLSVSVDRGILAMAAAATAQLWASVTSTLVAFAAHRFRATLAAP